MNLSNHFILLNGEPKTLQIDTIRRNGSKGYSVRFKNNDKSYNYSYDKVVWLSNPEWIDPTPCQVSVDGTLKNNVRELWKFTDANKYYWRVVYANGYIQDDAKGSVSVITSCLDEAVTKDTFTYLKNVANINPLGKDKDSNGILSDMYGKVDFIDDNCAAACYLNPEKHNLKALYHADLIYPFGCNASQRKAVTTAFERQMSVIQGPPGTGKTQTILNIIANIVRQGRTVLVVSNNNSATTNVMEKLDKYDLSFIVAALGSKENKDFFITNQPAVPTACDTWGISASDKVSMKYKLRTTLMQIDKVYALQNERAELLQEQQAIALEWKHFCIDNNVDEDFVLLGHSNSKRIIDLWLWFQSIANDEKSETTNWGTKLLAKLKWLWMKWICKYQLHTQNEINKDDLTPLIKELQTLYYLNRQREIETRTDEIRQELSLYNAKDLTTTLTDLSMALLKSSLHSHYSKHVRSTFIDTADMRRRGNELKEQYPVVLSTTFSARSCLFADQLYDYIIMDEASQVSIETGALALTCARNAVIVGDTLQLPNVITDDNKTKLSVIMKQYNIAEDYDCAKNSFLQSVLNVVKRIPETLLREHYRCHPRIINFCNQKFYGGSLLIMTEDKGEEDVLCAVKTVKGNHATVSKYNQREIDVIKEEVLPKLQAYGNIGVVTPYNNQVNEFNRQLPDVEAATIHKYQGREKDAIIMSVVDNQITPFADEANMLNVAVSRAKKKFCLVVTGNKQEHQGNITDLLDYIAYNNCAISESKLASIFDYLYQQYTEQRMTFLESHPKISEYASENLTYSLLKEVIASDHRFCYLNVLCHIPLRQVVKDTSMMTERELKYAANYSTHLDFLIINRVTKQPVLAIETDGYSYHNDETEQHKRDQMKDHILSNYGLPLLRLSTKGHNEREKILNILNTIIS